MQFLHVVSFVLGDVFPQVRQRLAANLAAVLILALAVILGLAQGFFRHFLAAIVDFLEQFPQFTFPGREGSAHFVQMPAAFSLWYLICPVVLRISACEEPEGSPRSAEVMLEILSSID